MSSCSSTEGVGKCSREPGPNGLCRDHTCSGCGQPKTALQFKCDTCMVGEAEPRGPKRSAAARLGDRQSFHLKRRQQSRGGPGRSTMAPTAVASSARGPPSAGKHVAVAVVFGPEVAAVGTPTFLAAARKALIARVQQTLPMVTALDVAADAADGTADSVTYVAQFGERVISRAVAQVLTEAIGECPIAAIVGGAVYASRRHSMGGAHDGTGGLGGSTRSPRPSDDDVLPSSPSPDRERNARPGSPEAPLPASPLAVQGVAIGAATSGVPWPGGGLPLPSPPDRGAAPDPHDDGSLPPTPPPPNANRRPHGERWNPPPAGVMDADEDGDEDEPLPASPHRDGNGSGDDLPPSPLPPSPINYDDLGVAPAVPGAALTSGITGHRGVPPFGHHDTHAQVHRSPTTTRGTCPYTSPGTTACRNNPTTEGGYCAPHTCPDCGLVKATLTAVCEKCARTSVGTEQPKPRGTCRYTPTTATEGRCQHPPEDGTSLCRQHACPECGDAKPGDDHACAECSTRSCGYTTQFGRLCPDLPTDSSPFCRQHLCVTCGSQKASFELACEMCTDIGLTPDQLHTDVVAAAADEVCGYRPRHGLPCWNEPQHGGTHCTLHACPTCGGSKTSADDRCAACNEAGSATRAPPLSTMLLQCDSHSSDSELEGAAGGQHPLRSCLEASPLHDGDGTDDAGYIVVGTSLPPTRSAAAAPPGLCTYVSDSGRTCSATAEVGCVLCAQHKCPGCANPKSSRESLCPVCKARPDAPTSGGDPPSTCGYVSPTGRTCRTGCHGGTSLCCRHLCPSCGQPKSSKETLCAVCTDAPSDCDGAVAGATDVPTPAAGLLYESGSPIAEDVYGGDAASATTTEARCGYVSESGRTCSALTLGSGRFCASHSCPSCGDAKSSRSAACEDCADDESPATACPQKCAYMSPTGRTCNTTAASGGLLCTHHQCPCCGNPKSSSSPACGKCSIASTAPSAALKSTAAECIYEHDGEDNDDGDATPFSKTEESEPARCAFVGESGAACPKTARAHWSFCSSHLCPQCHRSKSRGTVKCATCLANEAEEAATAEQAQENLYDGVTGSGVPADHAPTATCTYVSEAGLECYATALSDSSLCRFHQCPKCDNAKSSKNAVCRECREGKEAVYDTAEVIYGGDDDGDGGKTPNRVDQCMYISPSGRSCALASLEDGAFCAQHQCPECSQSKSSRQPRCSTCSGVTLCPYMSDDGRTCAGHREEGKLFCSSHQCPHCRGPKSSRASTCDDCHDAAATQCAFTSIAGQPCLIMALDHHVYCEDHQCPTCPESKAPFSRACPECITLCRVSVVSIEEEVQTAAQLALGGVDTPDLGEAWGTDDLSSSLREVIDVGEEPNSCLCRRRIEHGLVDSGVQGIATKRKTTDKWTLAIFILLCAALGYLSWYVVGKSTIDQFTAGLDSFGNICGTGNAPIAGINNSGVLLTDRPFLYYVDPTDAGAPAVCVKKCPYSDGDAGGLYSADNGFYECSDCSNTGATFACARCRTYQVCVHAGIQFGSAYPHNLPAYRDSESSCPPFVYKTTAVNGVCWPTQKEYGGSTEITAGFYANVPDAQLTFKRLSQTLDAAQSRIGIGMAVTAAVCLLEFVLFRVAVGVHPYYALGAVSLGVMATVAAVMWFEVQKHAVGIGSRAETSVAMFSLLAVFVTMYLCALTSLAVYVRHNVRLAMDMARQTARVLQADVSLLTGPFFLCGIILAYMWYYLWTMKHTVSTQSVTVDGNGYAILEHQDPPMYLIQITVAVHSIGVIWMVLFLLCAAALVRSFRTASKYFSRLEENLGDVETGTKKRKKTTVVRHDVDGHGHEDVVLNLESILAPVVRYHLGTIALSAAARFGQTAVGLVLWCAHAVFDALSRAHRGNRCFRRAAEIPKALRQFLTEYVSKSAHLQVALFSFDFYFASWINWELMSMNRLFWEEILAVSEAGFTLCKVLAAGCGVLYVYFAGGDDADVTLSLWIVMYASIFACWLVAEAYMQQFSIATSDLLCCFVEDHMWNDGSVWRPTHAHDELSGLLHDAREVIRKKMERRHDKEAKRHDAAVSGWRIASTAMVMKARLQELLHDRRKAGGVGTPPVANPSVAVTDSATTTATVQPSKCDTGVGNVQPVRGWSLVRAAVSIPEGRQMEQAGTSSLSRSLQPRDILHTRTKSLVAV